VVINCSVFYLFKPGVLIKRKGGFSMEIRKKLLPILPWCIFGLLPILFGCPDPCAQDPCTYLPNAIPGTCSPIDEFDFSCDCEMGFDWDETSHVCQEMTILGQLCGSCNGTFCQKGGTDICPGSVLDMPCVGTSAGMYCSQPCSGDDDCLNPYRAMKCLTNCPEYTRVEGICWEANDAVWMEDIVCQ
jgi:hypothetical protein